MHLSTINELAHAATHQRQSPRPRRVVRRVLWWWRCGGGPAPPRPAPRGPAAPRGPVSLLDAARGRTRLSATTWCRAADCDGVSSARTSAETASRAAAPGAEQRSSGAETRRRPGQDAKTSQDSAEAARDPAPHRDPRREEGATRRQVSDEGFNVRSACGSADG